MGGNVWLVLAINDGRSTYTSNGAISRRGQPVHRAYLWLEECTEVLGRGGPRGLGRLHVPASCPASYHSEHAYMSRLCGKYYDRYGQRFQLRVEEQPENAEQA